MYFGCANLNMNMILLLPLTLVIYRVNVIDHFNNLNNVLGQIIKYLAMSKN